MFIEDVHREYADETTGTKILIIKTQKTTVTTPRRAAQNTWCSNFKGDKECRGKSLPTSWIELSNKINDEKSMKETIDNLGTKADYLKDLNAPFRKNNVVEYFPTIDSIHYDKDGKEKITSLINLGIFSKADVIGIPDFNENTTTFGDKLRFVEGVLNDHPEGKKLDFIPYVRSDSRKFRDKISIIINQGINKIGVDYRGFGGISRTNFNKLQNFVRDLDKDIMVKVGHLPRKIFSTNASVSDLMTYFGADITAQRVNPPPKYLYDFETKKMLPRQLDSIEYYSPSDLGVMPKDQLPNFFGVDCNCPHHTKERYNKDNKFFISNAEKMAKRSVICEMFSSNLECERSKPSIRENNYVNYLRGKKCVKSTLDSLNNTSLDNYIF